ncbi:MAG: 50S ribosomal protein L11 methyltransferase, partial [Gaiellaceae bacterium]
MPPERFEEAVAQLLELAPSGFVEEVGKLVVYTDEDGVAALRERFREVESAPVAAGWEEEWRRFHVPVAIGPLWIGPPWQAPPPGLTAVVIDPGRAFGTGAHETTRLCVEFLLGLEGGSFLDVGCGSGVLAIAAAKLGFGPLIAVDVDEAAVDAARRGRQRRRARRSARRRPQREPPGDRCRRCEPHAEDRRGTRLPPRRAVSD